jgi:pimeloyl-ACP methyl ester carboxylesterase
MKSPARLFLGLLIAALLPLRGEESPPDGLAGTWSGSLAAGGQELPVFFEFTAAPGGQFTGVLKSPSQTPQPIPLTAVTFRDREVKVRVDLVGGSYTGKVAANGQTIRGEWRQGPNTLPLVLTRQPAGAAAAVAKRPQTPAPPYPYASEEVAFDNPAAQIRLAGTLTLPRGATRPVAAAILISGSGPQDRDETILDHKPFAVWADYLTRRGIAVLRYDDRGTGASTGEHAYGTTLDFATDAAAALTYLKTRKEIDPARIGLVGHSEGGLIAPIVAVKRPGEVAYLVLLAGPGLRGDEILMTQSRALMSAAGMKPELIELTSRLNRSIYDALTQPNPDGEKVRKLAADFEAELKKLSPDEAKALGEIGPGLEEQFKALQTPWFANFLALDPAPYLSQITAPVLALNGTRDLQVLAEPNLAAIERHLKAAGNTRFTTRNLPDLNHLFQKAETGLPGEYWRIETTVEHSVLKLVAEWIDALP